MKKNTLVAIGIVMVIMLAAAIVVTMVISNEPEKTIVTTASATTTRSSTYTTTRFTGASSNVTATTLRSLILVNDIFLGKWKEDQSKRQNLDDFLYYRGINWIKRTTAVNSANWWLTMNIARNGNIYAFQGKKGYYMEEYKFTLTPDNNTQSNIDLGTLDGPRLATTEFIDDGNSLMTRLRKPDTDEVDVLTIRTIDPNFPNVMSYKIKDVASGTELIQHMDKQS